MEKVWIKNYSKGVSDTIDPNAYNSINELFIESCEKFKNNTAFANMGQDLKFYELEQKVNAFAKFLQNDLNLSKGERIILMMPNLLQYPVAMFGAFKAGLIVVNVNPLYTANELEYIIKDSNPAVIVILENFANCLEQTLYSLHSLKSSLSDQPSQFLHSSQNLLGLQNSKNQSNHLKLQHVIVTKVSDMFSFPKSLIIDVVLKFKISKVKKSNYVNYINFSDALKKGAQISAYKDPDLQGNDTAYLQYTGGTTGKSKGAILTHRNMIANIEQCNAWLKGFLEPGKEIVVTALPLYHIFSLTANCLTFIKNGSKNVLITNPKDLNSFIKQIKRIQFTAITGVNTLFNTLLNNPKFLACDFSKLKIAVGGGMSVHSQVASKWKQVTNVPLLEAYGLTETSPAVCMNPLHLSSYNGTVGCPIPSTEIAIRDDEGKDLGFNEVGELCVRGPQVMRGYWNNQEETALVLDDKGWLRTGDIALINKDGFVTIVDRKKDVILVSGFNVYPNEVEDVISKMNEVLEVAVFGIPNGLKGEIVCSYIVTRNNCNINPEDVVNHCKKYLAAYKIPKKIEFREKLPKTNVGKILRKALKEENIVYEY